MAAFSLRVLIGIVLAVASVLCMDRELSGDLKIREESFVTNHWAIELEDGANPEEIAERHGHVLVGKVHALPGVYVFKKKPDTEHGVTHPHHNESSEITWFEQQVATLKQKRSEEFIAPSDPLYQQQWHLHASGSDVVNINVEPVWRSGITGEGVTIAVVDDGLEHTHPDLNANYKSASSYDFNYDDPNPFPDSREDNHGTSASGVAAARDNGVCGVGSAYRAGLAGIRLISAASTDLQESNALTYKWDLNSIYSNSWGPVDDGRRKEGPGRLAAAGLARAVQQGRDGKGSLYVWAGGNGRSYGDNCNYDGWANSRYTITVGAVDHLGLQSGYSESCSMLLVSAPSSGSRMSITTTDLLGMRGNSGDCTNSFGGTSSAAPLVAGVVALILQKNPNLGWRDVQGVFVESSTKIQPDDTDWQRNGAGHFVNHKFGFGLANAEAAVARAATWVNLPENKALPEARQDVNGAIPEDGTLVTSIEITDDIIVEHVMIRFVATHPRRGEITIKLTSPSGTVSVLAEKHGDAGSNYDWTFGSIFQWGESSKGTWTLEVADAVTSSPPRKGSLNSWFLNIYGH
eukprot:TRINITY_DN1901_c0_g1_i1.p1 TRINITY_DN1901_c0_g1~~TRINITY_DN1901_c0_g1_i1.p1  ORF type:complete len:575 (+),score=136.02 TRINITY_DN1901_c0_g1_i1:46-1770(+)